MLILDAGADVLVKRIFLHSLGQCAYIIVIAHQIIKTDPIIAPAYLSSGLVEYVIDKKNDAMTKRKFDTILMPMRGLTGVG